MNKNFNFVFCKYHSDKEYCYKHCNRECPSVSNLWHRLVRNPIVNFFIVIKCGFVKCNQMPTQCSFLYKNKYCLLKDRNCYSNRENKM